MLKKLIVIPLVAIALSIGSVAVAPPVTEAKACEVPYRLYAPYPGYMLSIARPNFDDNVYGVQDFLSFLYAKTGFIEYNISVDGYFGPATQRAVIAYQSRHGLQSDGIIGPATWSSMQNHGK